MANQRLKDFWINKITTLIGNYQLLPNLLDEGDNWADKFQDLQKFVEIGNYARAVCRDVYIKAGKNVPQSFTTTAENYSNLLGDSYKDLENEYIELVNVMKTKIGVDPESNATVVKNDKDGNVIDANYPKWKDDIEQKIYNEYSKLTDIPGNLDLADLMYRSKIYEEIRDNLDNIIEGNLPQPKKVSYLGLNWDYKVNQTALQGYKNRENQIKNALNRADIPANWDNDVKPLFQFLVNDLNVDPDNLPVIPATEDLASLLARPTQTELDNVVDWKDDLERGFKEILEMAPTDALPNSLVDLGNLYKNKSGSQTVIQLKTKADNYDHIHTKLNGKVSDTELQALLDAIPTCSHTDYDTIKTERDQLKTEQATQEQAKQQAIQAKETEIITKIITDLQLSTERERENVLEAVITEIKAKITPPADTTAKDNKISELETKLATLQAPKSLTDLPISEEVKAEVIKISQELGLTAQSCAKLESAASYQELSNFQKEAFQEKLNSEIDSRKSANYLNWGLGALSLGSLLILAWILVKKTTFTPEIGGKKEKKIN